jgi:hypothetical protein
MSERHFWQIAVTLPALVGAALASDAAAAGCYSAWMNCFSIVEANTVSSRAMFWTARFLPYALPAYGPVALALLIVLARSGPAAARRFAWALPLVFSAGVSLACPVFASWVLPARQLAPTLELTLGTLAGGYAYVALAQLAKRALVAKPRYWD